MRRALSCAGFAMLSLVSGRLQAQHNATYSVGINAGTFIYIGDLSPSATGSWKTPGFVWGLNGQKHLLPSLSARLDVSFGKLRGDEARYASPEYRQYRAFAFNSQVTEIVVSAEYHPLQRERRVSPYLFAGVGYSGMRIRRDYSRFNESYFINEPSLKELLGQDASTALPRGVAILPVGLGLKYQLSRRFALTGEAAHRFTQSDLVDGFSYAANPGKKDSYTKYSVGLRYSIGSKNPYACPPIRY